MSLLSRLFRRQPRLSFVRLSESAQLPVYATDGAAGMDLFADHDAIVPILGRVLVKTNIAVMLPRDCEAQIRARSGLANKHGITIMNGIGTIDPDYEGGLGVILFNGGETPFAVKKGDRIAQLVINRFVRVRPRLAFKGGVMRVQEPRQGTRGAGGFGSTGTSAVAAAGLAVASVAPVHAAPAVLAAQRESYAVAAAAGDPAPETIDMSVVRAAGAPMRPDPDARAYIVRTGGDKIYLDSVDPFAAGALPAIYRASGVTEHPSSFAFNASDNSSVQEFEARVTGYVAAELERQGRPGGKLAR